MNTITFSSDTRGFTRKDVEFTGKQVYQEFGKEKTLEQAMPSKKLNDWIYANCQPYLNIIRNEKQIIGHAFMIPTSLEVMRQFLDQKITEKELFDIVMTHPLPSRPEAIYLCDAILHKDYRRKGLATTALIKLLEPFKHRKITLYAWAYSSEGGMLTRKLAKTLGLKLRVRKDSARR